jgi:hypothetical protein
MEKCAKDGCTFKKSANKYCGKHQADLFVEETKELGLKHCANYIRGCRTQNELTYKKSKCEDCLLKDREKEKARRKAVVETEEGTKRCNTCFQVYSVEDFQGTRGETLTCKMCRESNKRADEKRDKDHVHEIARKNAQKPERKAVKKEWKEKNPEKCAKYWIDARARDIEKDSDAYLQKQAEQSKKWRDANPEKVKENNETKINCIHYQYCVYMTTSKTRNLEFTINEEEFTDMVKSPCYYCGIIQDKGFNGIDRLDSTKPYHKENCVGCCERCNMMKGSLGPNIFVHRVEHILTHLEIVQGKLYPEEFSNSKSRPYSEYVRRALSKNLIFEVPESVFTSKREEPCYLCGKEKSESHNNGIDRFDNTKGYTKDNIRSCCWNCNFMKKDLDYDSLLNKLNLIYNNQLKCPIQENESKEMNHIVRGNKLSKEEMEQRKYIRKKERMNNLREKYLEDKTKNEWITEIVANRQARIKK